MFVVKLQQRLKILRFWQINFNFEIWVSECKEWLIVVQNQAMDGFSPETQNVALPVKLDLS